MCVCVCVCERERERERERMKQRKDREDSNPPKVFWLRSLFSFSFEHRGRSGRDCLPTSTS